MAALDEDVFLGAWKFVSCDNFDAYLKEIGINVVLRKLAMLANPTVIFTKKDGKGGNEVWVMKTETFVKSCSAEFQLNVTFEETTIDDRKVQSTFSLEKKDSDMVFVHTQLDKQGRLSRIERTIRGDDMNVHMEVNGVISTAVFRKVKK